MVSLRGIGGDDDENADDREEVEDDCPPRKERESVVGRTLNMGEDRTEEGDNPRQLSSQMVSIR